MPKTPLTISYWPNRKLMTIAGQRLRVTAEGNLAPGRYNIGAPKTAPGVGTIAIAKIPASSIVRVNPVPGGRFDTIYAGRIRGNTIDAKRGRADTIYAGRHRFDTVYAGARRFDTIYAGGRKLEGLVELHLVPFAQRNKYPSVPTILLKTGCDELLDRLQTAGGAVLVVYA